MINRRSAGLGFLWGEQRLQPLPLRIGQISSVHTDQYNDLNRVCKHILVLQWQLICLSGIMIPRA